jgi:hypothetical protein
VYCTVKLFLDIGEVIDHKRLSRCPVVCTQQVINAVRSRINLNPVWQQKNHGSGNEYCAENHEWHYQTRFAAFKRQTEQCLTVALKENGGKIKSLLLYGKEHYKEILFTNEKLWRKLSISKMMEFMQSSIKVRKLMSRIKRGHHPASMMVWWDNFLWMYSVRWLPLHTSVLY